LCYTACHPLSFRSRAPPSAPPLPPPFFPSGPSQLSPRDVVVFFSFFFFFLFPFHVAFFLAEHPFLAFFLRFSGIVLLYIISPATHLCTLLCIRTPLGYILYFIFIFRNPNRLSEKNGFRTLYFLLIHISYNLEMTLPDTLLLSLLLL